MLPKFIHTDLEIFRDNLLSWIFYWDKHCCYIQLHTIFVRWYENCIISMWQKLSFQTFHLGDHLPSARQYCLRNFGSVTYWIVMFTFKVFNALSDSRWILYSSVGPVTACDNWVKVYKMTEISRYDSRYLSPFLKMGLDFGTFHELFC